jgi:hypothetical protein
MTLSLSDKLIDYLLEVADRYALANGLSRGTVSKRFLGAAGVLDQLDQRKRTISVTTFDKTLMRFRAEWSVGDFPVLRIKFPC